MVIVITGDGSKRTLPDGRKTRDYTPRKVLRVIPKDEQVIVEGVNVHKKHVRPSQNNPQGGVVEKEMPIHISNVMPSTGGKDPRPTRVRFQVKEDGSKVRVAVRTGEQLGPALRKAK